MALLSASVGAQPGTGSIVGRVTLTTRVGGAALPTSSYPSRRVGPPPAASPEIQNVVLYLKDPAFRGPLPVTTTEIKQQDETFVPRVVVITQGSSVDFLNDDPFFHNVFSLSSAKVFDLGRYPQGQSRSQKFTKAGLVK